MDEIGDLLERADTPSERATLLVLYKIQQNLGQMSKDFIEHRSEFAEHRVDFEKHVVDEQKLMNRGIGGWMAISVFLATALTVTGWYISRHIIDLNVAQQITIDNTVNRVTALETLAKEIRSKDQR